MRTCNLLVPGHPRPPNINTLRLVSEKLEFLLETDLRKQNNSDILINLETCHFNLIKNHYIKYIKHYPSKQFQIKVNQIKYSLYDIRI